MALLTNDMTKITVAPLGLAIRTSDGIPLCADEIFNNLNTLKAFAARKAEDNDGTEAMAYEGQRVSLVTAVGNVKHYTVCNHNIQPLINAASCGVINVVEDSSVSISKSTTINNSLNVTGATTLNDTTTIIGKTSNNNSIILSVKKPTSISNQYENIFDIYTNKIDIHKDLTLNSASLIFKKGNTSVTAFESDGILKASSHPDIGATDTSKTKTADPNTTTNASSFITGINLDSKGHVTGVTSGKVDEIDEETLIFKNNLNFTEPFGKYNKSYNKTDDFYSQTKDGTGTVRYYTLNTADKSLKTVLEKAFSTFVKTAGTKTNPSLSFLTSNISGEVGDSFNPEIAISTSPGSYTYGPATGVTFTINDVLKCTNNSYSDSGATSIKGNNSGNTYTVYSSTTVSNEKFTDSDQTFYFKVKYAHTASPYKAYWNDGTANENGVQITAATNQSYTGSRKYTGYRRFWVGYCNPDKISSLSSSAIWNAGIVVNESSTADFKILQSALTSTTLSVSKTNKTFNNDTVLFVLYPSTKTLTFSCKNAMGVTTTEIAKFTQNKTLSVTDKNENTSSNKTYYLYTANLDAGSYDEFKIY